jgi:GT2 family glycosyltransferase
MARTRIDCNLKSLSVRLARSGPGRTKLHASIVRSNVGVVAIGRNEGESLDKCLQSIAGRAAATVYVDSGSDDGSLSRAREAGCHVIAMDTQVPFTAARARNDGFRYIRQLAPHLPYVQFIDGDCELVEDWIPKAVAFLDEHRDVAVVCGRRRERRPTNSIYNMLCDVEWNTPIGDTKACGGDALVRADAFEQVGRYRADLIAGEDPELCVRFRTKGWRVYRLDAEMTLHDAAMTRFGQWWRRTVRSGYAFAQGAHLHGAPPERHFVWQSRRAWLWGICLPLMCMVASILYGGWGWATWLVYPLQVLRLTVRSVGPLRQRALVALFQVLARFPEGAGQIKFLGDRLIGRQARIIEYK